MEVVILCGGRGTRLGAETEIRPKPMVEIGEKPILWHIMKYYAHFGHKDFILCLGYKGEIIKDYFLNYEAIENDVTVELGKQGAAGTSGSAGAALTGAVTYHSSHAEEGWRVTLASTGLDANTGARVKRVEKYIQGDEFLLTYGDGVSDVDLGALVEFHRTSGKIAAVTAVHPPARFGELRIVEGKAEVFSEKPQTSAGLVNGGFMAADRKLFGVLSADAGCSLEHDGLGKLADDGELAAFEHRGFWQCVDTVRELTVLRELWDSGRAPWKVW